MTVAAESLDAVRPEPVLCCLLPIARCRLFTPDKPRSISPGGGPKKGINKANKDFFPSCSLNVRVLKLGFLAFSGGPGGFRELREAGRNHFHLSWYLIVPGIKSYGQNLPAR